MTAGGQRHRQNFAPTPGSRGRYRYLTPSAPTTKISLEAAMAGSHPKRMLAKVTSLEERAWDLVEAVSQAMPERYVERDERMRDDPIWVAWYLAAHEMDGAWLWLEKLRTLLAEKVGSPCESEEDSGGTEKAET